MTYQLANGNTNVVMKDDSGVILKFIPNDPANTDWQAYQQWLSDGNTPEPAP
jgi:hypothetical protein